MIMLEGFSATVRDEIVKSEGEGGERDARVGVAALVRPIVDVPIIRTDEASEIGMEEMVTAGAPGISVIPFGRTRLVPGDGSVKVCPATA